MEILSYYFYGKATIKVVTAGERFIFLDSACETSEPFNNCSELYCSHVSCNFFIPFKTYLCLVTIQ